MKEERPLGFAQAWTYEPLGDIKSATDADGRTTTNTYTPRRYLESESNHASETTTYGYDGEGHRTSMRRPLGVGHDWTYAYDEGDRLVGVTDPVTAAAGSSTTFGYDLDGNLTSQTDANGHTTTFDYDARHHRTGLIYPSTAAGTASAHWTWDADGNVATETTPNGKVLTSTFDALNRQTAESIDAPLATEIAQTGFRQDGNGNVVQIDETINGTTRHATHHYDAFDRLDADTDVHGKQAVYAYDAVGNRLQLSSDGATTLWGYNALNQNDAVTVPGQGTTALAYFPSGKLHVLTRPDGSTSTTEYDTAGRIQSIVHAKAGSEIAHAAYAYDANGNRTEQKEANGAVTGNAEQRTTYTYDNGDRLTDTQTPDRSTHYVLDATGNRTHETIRDASNVLIGDSTLVYNARGQLTTRDDPAANVHVALTYDADGNTQTQTDASGPRMFRYDARDRLMTLEQPNAPPLGFDYQSDGLRIAKRQASQETRYQYDQQSLLAETNSIGNSLARYHYSATQLISRTEPGSTPTQRHYLLDSLATPIALLTQQGSVSARTKYDAWGEIVTQQNSSGTVTNSDTDGAIADLTRTDAQPIGYTGYLTDSESGLYYAKARYYDPCIARFTTEDPEEGHSMQPPSLHRYLYAYANPTVYTDPDGRCAEPVTAFLCLAALGAEIGFSADFLSQEHESLSAGRSDTLGGFVRHDYDVKRGALNTAVGAATGPIGGGLAQIGVRPAIAIAASVTTGAGMQTGVEALTTTDPNFDPKEAFLRNEAIGAAFAVGGPIVARAAKGAFNALAPGLSDSASRVAAGLRSKVGAADSVVIAEDAASAAARLERKMPISPDSDFRPLSQPSLGASGKTFVVPREKADLLAEYQRAAVEGRLIRTDPKTVRGSGFRSKVEQEHGPPPSESYQADHKIELCIGGADCAKTNGQWLDQPLNSASGAKIGNQIKSDPIGTKYTSVILEKPN
ncbi:RHS repeat domain-containing protein [Dokdonella sp.]|uniref:RHS repeat domain-containing protein n=1 Tax=Dokdonella sp. TaxID=2291710 RepID=UPI00387EAA03